MDKELKVRTSITLSKENSDWLKQLSKQSGIPVSLFIDSLIRGVRATIKDGLTEQEGISMALEQIARGLR